MPHKKGLTEKQKILIKKALKSLKSVYDVDTNDNGDFPALNRRNADKIIAIISSVSIKESRLSDKLKSSNVEEFGECEEELLRQALIDELNNNSSIDADITEIDEYNLNFAKFYREAANHGRDLTFQFAGTALAHGIDARKDFKYTEETIDQKKYFLSKLEILYKMLQGFRVLDEKIFNVNCFVEKRATDLAELTAKREKLRNYLLTEEGIESNKELLNNPAQLNGAWSSEAKKLCDERNDVLRGEQSLKSHGVFAREFLEYIHRYEKLILEFLEEYNHEFGFSLGLTNYIEYLLSSSSAATAIVTKCINSIEKYFDTDFDTRIKQVQDVEKNKRGYF